MKRPRLRSSRLLPFLPAAAVLLGLTSGCSRDEPEYYEETASPSAAAEVTEDPAPGPAGEGELPPGHPPLDGMGETLPEGHPPLAEGGSADSLPEGHPPLDGGMPGGMMDMSNQTLDPSLIARGDLPTWELPEGWAETEPGPMRRANLVVDESGLEVAVTSFPGDVGGLPANVNRWRRQLGLPPVPESQMLPFITETSVDGRGVLLVDLLGPPQPDGEPTQRMYTAVTMNAGNSWFFKMTGDAAAIEASRPAFLEFIRSLRFPAVASEPAE